MLKIGENKKPGMDGAKRTAKHQGRLLKQLYEWSGEPNQEAFAKTFNRGRHWYKQATGWERLPMKIQYEIINAYPQISLAYFEGTQQLPERKNNSVEEIKIEYLKSAEMLTKEVAELKDQIVELNRQLLQSNKMNADLLKQNDALTKRT